LAFSISVKMLWGSAVSCLAAGEASAVLGRQALLQGQQSSGAWLLWQAEMLEGGSCLFSRCGGRLWQQLLWIWAGKLVCSVWQYLVKKPGVRSSLPSFEIVLSSIKSSESVPAPRPKYSYPKKASIFRIIRIISFPGKTHCKIKLMTSR